MWIGYSLPRHFVLGIRLLGIQLLSNILLRTSVLFHIQFWYPCFIVCFRLGNNTMETFEMLKAALAEKAMGKTQVPA
jgi:hypothetical protein